MWRKIVKLAAAPLTMLLFLIMVALWQPAWLIALLAWHSPVVVYTVDTQAPLVALTIDDGPDAQTTPQILNILKQHNAHATFFLITGHIPGNEAIVRRAVQEGHELGNHLIIDQPSVDLSRPEFERQLVSAHQTLSKFGPVRWFRPGSGWFNGNMLAVARKHHYQTALGSIYPFDPHIPWPWFATRHILAKVQPGSVIILHDKGGRGQRTALTLAAILPELKRRGYKIVTLTELRNSNLQREAMLP